MTARNINLPAKIFLRNVGGKAINLDCAKLPDGVLAGIFEVGAKTMLTNVFNGQGKAATDAARLDALEKKMAAWYRGELNVVSRGESQYTAMREQYIDERRAATKATRSEVEKAIKETVKAVFGADESATFSKFLDAVATLKAKQAGTEMADEREAIETALVERTEKAAAERAKVADKIDLSAIDLGL